MKIRELNVKLAGDVCLENRYCSRARTTAIYRYLKGIQTHLRETGLFKFIREDDEDQVNSTKTM